MRDAVVTDITEGGDQGQYNVGNERLDHKWREDDMDNNKEKAEPVLNGTFAAVLLLGAFLIASWVAVYLLFISRN